MTVKRVCPYPVGEIRMSVNATDPATIWPNTSWERIQDCMLMMAGSTYAAGQSYGSATHTLTAGELPSHTHSVGAHKHTVPAHGHAHTITATTPQFTHSITQPAFSVTGGAVTDGITGGSHTHKYRGYRMCAQTNTGNKVMAGGYYASDPEDTSSIVASTHTHNLPAHSHTCSRTTNVAVGAHASAACTISGGVTDKAAFDTNDSTAFDSGATGGGEAFSILNPCLAVYCWKRVA